MTLTPLEFKLVLSMSNRPNEVVSDQEIHAVSYGFRTQNRSTANQFYIVDTNGGKKAPPVVDETLSLGARKRDCASRMASTEDRAVGSTQWASG